MCNGTVNTYIRLNYFKEDEIKNSYNIKKFHSKSKFLFKNKWPGFSQEVYSIFYQLNLTSISELLIGMGFNHYLPQNSVLDFTDNMQEFLLINFNENNEVISIKLIASPSLTKIIRSK